MPASIEKIIKVSCLKARVYIVVFMSKVAGYDFNWGITEHLNSQQQNNFNTTEAIKQKQQNRINAL
jgi:hypothetical protein